MSETTVYEANIPVGDFILVERREGWIIIGIGTCGKQAYMHLSQAADMAISILADTQPVKTLRDENIELKWALVDAVTETERMKKTIADTQPVKVQDEVGAWELDEWTRLAA